MLFFVLVISTGKSAIAQTEPPPPYFVSAQQEIGDGPPCAEGKDGDGSGTQPPPGLCLPINDYLAPLFFAGLLLGAFSLKRKEKLL